MERAAWGVAAGEELDQAEHGVEAEVEVVAESQLAFHRTEDRNCTHLDFGLHTFGNIS